MTDASDGWSDVAPAQGASSLTARMYATDAALQANHPNWPTGGTAAQIQIESRGNNNAVSPKGATGIAQMMPVTFENIKKQMGRPDMDIHNQHDQLMAHQYLMNQNLDRTNGDPIGATAMYNSGRATPDNPETRGYVDQFAKRTGYTGQPAAPANVSANGDDGWENVGKPAGSDDGWETIGKAQPGVLDNIGNWASGLGQAAAHVGSSMGAQAIGGLHSLADLATGHSDQATADIQRDADKFTYQPRTPEGKQLSGYADKAMDFVGNTIPEKLAPLLAQGIANQTGYDKPITPEDLDQMKTLQQGLMTIEMGRGMTMGPEMARAKAAGAAGELDKLNAQPPLPEAPPGPAMAPNEGPQRPMIAASNGDIGTPAQMNDPAVQLARDRAQGIQQQAAGDLFPDTLKDTTGQASPYDPNRAAMESPFDVDTMQGQGKLDIDPVKDKMQAMRDGTPEQLDIFSDDNNAAKPYDNMSGEETPRSLAPDEFAETLQNLAEKDGTRFQMPEDMDGAYSKYLDTVRDDQGGLFDRPTVAKNFADMALKETIERRINDHPVVKANTAKLQAAQARVDGFGAKVPQGAKDALAQAQATLQKSVDNIGSHFKDAAKAVAPWQKDGVVYMHTFGDLGTLAKSIGAVLKGIHGIVFKTLDKVVPKIKNLDSDKKIFAQGIKDAINRQATRDWSQTVNEKPKAQLNGIPGMRKALDAFDPYEAQSISPAELKQQMMQANDLPSGGRAAVINNVLQGGQQLTSFYRNPIVKFTTESVDRAVRDTKLFVKTNLSGKDGLRTKMQALNPDELTGVRSLMELNEGKREFTPAELKHQGFSDKQIDYYNKSLELEKDAFNKFNAGRAQAGLPPVDRRIAHIAGYFMGDFKRIVTDGEGKVVAVLAHNNRHSLETITKRFLEDHPNATDLKAEPIKLNKLKDTTGAGDNRFHGYMEAINMLKDTNADVARVVQTYKDYMSKDAQAAMQNRSKFKSKDGVLGAEGRKSWQSATKNATDGAKQQLRYLESLDKWSNMQDAIAKSKEFLADADIDKPNAKALSQKYLDAVQGRNQGPVQHAVNGILNGVAEATGIGPSILKGMNNTTKSLVLMKFVGLFKLSHSAVTMVQPLQAIPALNQLLRSRGLDLPRLHGTSLTSIGRSLQSSFNMFANQKLSPFEKGAADFMAKNGTADVGMSNHFDNVTARSATGEKAKHFAELNVSIPEQGARTFTMMYYSHMLKDLGLPEGEIFPTAHNLMRNAMVDYSPHERSMVFGKMGIMGDIASTLTRFKYNQISNHMVGAAEAQRGNGIAPLAHTIAASVALGGIRGIFGYEAANESLKAITNGLARIGVMKEPTSLDELTLKALHGIDAKYTGMKDAMNWGAFSAMGVNMTGSLTNADSIPVDPLGSFVPGQGELSSVGGAALDVAVHQNKQSLKGAAMALAPNSMKGMLEDALFTKDGKYTNPRTGMLEAKRSTADEVKRAFSFRPLEESKNSFIARTAEEKEGDISSLKHDILEKAKSDIMSNNGKPDPKDMQKWAGKYTALGGDPSSFVSDMTAFLGKGQNLDRLQRQQGIPTGGSLSEATRYKRTEELK